MSQTVKNALVTALALVVMVVLFRFAWVLAGFVIKLVLSLLIFAVLAGLVLYLYRQVSGRRG